MTAWAARHWPTLIVAALTIYGLASMVAVFALGEFFLARTFGIPALFAVFPFPFAFFLVDFIGVVPGATITACAALLTVAWVDEMNRRFRRGGVAALAIYVGLCVWVWLHVEEISLWGTALRRVCSLCARPP